MSPSCCDPLAEAASLTGHLELQRPDGQPIHDFRYGVVRTWQQPTEAILQGPLNLVPMAILADAPPESARTVVERIDARLSREATIPDADRLRKSTFLLGTLRFEKATLNQPFAGAPTMKLFNDNVLKDIAVTSEEADEMVRRWNARLQLEEALRKYIEVRVDEARSILLELATDRFGEPDEAQKTQLVGITDHDRLVRLCKKVGKLASWDELLTSELTS